MFLFCMDYLHTLIQRATVSRLAPPSVSDVEDMLYLRAPVLLGKDSFTSERNLPSNFI